MNGKPRTKSNNSARNSPNPSPKPEENEYTMLMLHVEENNFKEIQSLFNRNAVLNIDLQNKTGQNALILATRNGNFEIAEYLVSKNADINSQNKAGQSPLFIACWFGFYDIAELLLDQGADVNLPDYRGWTPLMIACYHSHQDIVLLLLQAKAEISSLDCFGKRAIHRCKDEEIYNIIAELENMLGITDQPQPDKSFCSETSEALRKHYPRDFKNHHREQSSEIENPRQRLTTQRSVEQIETPVNISQNIDYSNEVSPILSPEKRFPDSPAIDLNSEDGELINSESVKRSQNFSETSPKPKSKFLMKGTKTPSKPNSKTATPTKKTQQNSDKNVDMKRLIKEMGKRTTPTPSSTPTPTAKKELSKNNTPVKKDTSRKTTNQSKEHQPNQSNLPQNVDFEKAFKAYIADYSNQMEKVVNNKVSYALNFEWKRSAYRIQRMFFDFFVQKSRAFHNSLVEKMQDHLISYVEETELADIKAKMTGLTQEFDALWNFEEIKQSLGLEEMTALSIIANPNEVDSLIIKDLEKDPHKGVFNITNVADNNVMAYLKEEIQTNINKTFLSLNATVEKDLAKSEALTLNLLKKSVQHLYTDLGKNLQNIQNHGVHHEEEYNYGQKKGILRNSSRDHKDFNEAPDIIQKFEELKKSRKEFRDNYFNQDIIDQSSEIVCQFEEFPNQEESPQEIQNKPAAIRNEIFKGDSISTDHVMKNFDMERISDHLNEKRKETIKNDFKIKFKAESEGNNQNVHHGDHHDESKNNSHRESRENVTLNKRISQMSGFSQDSVEILMKPRLTPYHLDQEANSNAISKRVSSSSAAVETTVPQNQIEIVEAQIDECTEKDSVRQTADCTVNFEDNNKEVKQMSRTMDEKDSDHQNQVLNHSEEIDEEKAQHFLEQNAEEERIKAGGVLVQSPNSKEEQKKNASEFKRSHSREDSPLKKSHLPGSIEEITPRSNQAEENSLKRTYSRESNPLKKSHLPGSIEEITPRQSENQLEENPFKRSHSREDSPLKKSHLPGSIEEITPRSNQAEENSLKRTHSREDHPLKKSGSIEEITPQAEETLLKRSHSSGKNQESARNQGKSQNSPTEAHHEKVFAQNQNQDQEKDEGVQSISELNCGGEQKQKKLLTINSYESDEEENKKGEHNDHLNTPNFSNSAQANKKSNSISSFQTNHGRTAASRSKSGFIAGSLTDADADVDKISAINSRDHSPERPFGKSGTDFFDRSEHDMSISNNYGLPDKSCFANFLGNDTINSYTLNVVAKIPVPSPSKNVKSVANEQIDEIPLNESFHYPGQPQRQRSHSYHHNSRSYTHYVKSFLTINDDQLKRERSKTDDFILN